jgi:hypothetical protein
MRWRSSVPRSWNTRRERDRLRLARRAAGQRAAEGAAAAGGQPRLHDRGARPCAGVRLRRCAGRDHAGRDPPAGRGRGAVAGRARRPVLAAAMCWDEANEGLARAHGRPALAVAPLALAALAEGRATLRDALAAFALGYEVGGRAGEAWRIRPGMHVDGSWHALGAAAAAARLAGGDAEGAARAVRLAGCQVPFALYAPIAAGMDGRNTYPAHAVLLGTLAAAGAMAGMDAPEAASPRRGGSRSASMRRREAPPAPGCSRKPISSPSPACATRITPPPPRSRCASAWARDVRAHHARDLCRGAALRRQPRAARAITAQFSLSWAVAAALVQGDLGPAAYTDAALADPALRRLEAMVTAEAGRGCRADADAVRQIPRRDARLRMSGRGDVVAHSLARSTPRAPHSAERARLRASAMKRRAARGGGMPCTGLAWRRRGAGSRRAVWPRRCPHATRPGAAPGRAWRAWRPHDPRHRRRAPEMAWRVARAGFGHWREPA